MVSSAVTAALINPLFSTKTFLASSKPPTTLSSAFLPSKRFVFPNLTLPKLVKAASRLRLVPFVAADNSDWAPEEKGEDVAEDVSEEEIGGEGKGEGGVFADPPEDAKLFVGNLPFDFDSEQLANLFNQSGVVEIAEVMYNRETELSRGFGFVTMSTIEEAEKAMEMLNGYEVNKRYLTVNKAAPRGTRVERAPRSFEPSFRIYVGNLPWQTDDTRLEQVFSEHGKVVDARIVYDRETLRSRGFCFITMSSESEMNDAITALDGQTLDGRSIRVNAAEDRPRRSNF